VVQELERIADAFAKRDLPLMALKGAASLLTLYPDTACRRLGDLDLLVRPDATMHALGTLYALGYALDPGYFTRLPGDLLVGKADGLFCRLPDSSSIIDLHNYIHGLGPARVRATEEVWARTRPVAVGDASLLCPCTEDAFLIAAACFARAVRIGQGAAHWRSLLDMGLMTVSNAIDWQEMRARAAFWGLRGRLEQAIATLNHYWGLDIPAGRSGAALVPIETLCPRPEVVSYGAYARLRHGTGNVLRGMIGPPVRWALAWSARAWNTRLGH
jgi:hypothetical protein